MSDGEHRHTRRTSDRQVSGNPACSAQVSGKPTVARIPIVAVLVHQVAGTAMFGKSFFVNALLDRRHLAAADANPETAAITVFQHGEEV